MQNKNIKKEIYYLILIMLKGIRHIVFVLLMVLPLLSLARLANTIDKTVGTYFIGNGTCVSINKLTQMVIKSNLDIETDILGDGDLIIRSSRASYINAHDKSIANLLLMSESRVELKSNLRVIHKLSILSGRLYLDNFILYINSGVELVNDTYRRIVESGFGIMVYELFTGCECYQLLSNDIFSIDFNNFAKLDLDFVLNLDLYDIHNYCYHLLSSELFISVFIPPPRFY